MATTIGTKLLTATVAAAVAFTGFAPAANAGILDILGKGLSVSAGDQADYDATPTTQSRHETTPSHVVADHNTPMASDYLANQAEGSKVDMLGVDYGQAGKVWKNKLYRAKSLEMAGLINRHRAARGEGPMRLDPAMSAAAQNWADYMARTHWFDHDPANKKNGEIIALRYNIDDPDVTEKLIEDYERSPMHNQLLHNDRFKAMGVGIAESTDGSGQVYSVVRLYFS